MRTHVRKTRVVHTHKYARPYASVRTKMCMRLQAYLRTCSGIRKPLKRENTWLSFKPKDVEKLVISCLHLG